MSSSPLGCIVIVVAVGIYALAKHDETIKINKKLEDLKDTHKAAIASLSLDLKRANAAIASQETAIREQTRASMAQKEAAFMAYSVWRNYDIRELADEYPYIPLLPEEPTLARIFYDQITGVWGMGNEDEDEYDAFFRHALRSYARAPLRKNKPVLLCLLSDQKFWLQADELSNHKIGKNAGDPRDWKIRRRIVHEREQGRCQRCGHTLTLAQSHVHHITPRSEDGNHHLDNLALLCKDCHTYMPNHDWMRDPILGYYDPKYSDWKPVFHERLEQIHHYGEYARDW